MFKRWILPLFALSASVSSAAEPVELTRLRTQYVQRVEKQVAPLQQTYVAELQKLEQRLAKEGRLEDALSIKQERESIRTDVGGEKAAPSKLPKTKEEVAKLLANSVWTLYDQPEAAEPHGHFILLQGGRLELTWTPAKGTWKALDGGKIEFTHDGLNGSVVMKISKDVASWDGEFTGDQRPRWGKLVVLDKSK